MLVPWHVMHIGMSCMLVCHACWYVMHVGMSCMLVCLYVGVSCMLVCNVCWCVMHVGVSCMLVCHVCWCVMYVGVSCMFWLLTPWWQNRKRRRNAEGTPKERRRCVAYIYSLALGPRLRNLFLAFFINSGSEKLSIT